MRKSEGRTFLQCTDCGKIYRVDRAYSIESLYVDSFCPRCNNGRALNIGNDEMDLYLYYDVTKDSRYSEY